MRIPTDRIFVFHTFQTSRLFSPLPPPKPCILASEVRCRRPIDLLWRCTDYEGRALAVPQRAGRQITNRAGRMAGPSGPFPGYLGHTETKDLPDPA